MTHQVWERAPALIASYPKLRVSVTKGPDAGASAELSYLPLRVGGSAECDLVLNDPGVAQHHVVVEAVTSGARIRDEASGAGVFLDKVQILEVVAALPLELTLGESVLRIERLPENVTRAQAEGQRFGELLGRSARMREVFAELEAIARGDASVLIQGERGSGRQLVAESIHEASRRTSGPFVVVDCSDLGRPSESKLFGHERGAFVGASEPYEGAFERAHSGALYLHEVGALPRALQAELGRVLEAGEVKRRGAERGTPVDVRVLASSSKNLAAEVQRGNFQRDLLQKLSGSQVKIPALRDRVEDLPLLVEHFMERVGDPNANYDVPSSVWDMFAAYAWPGNVRELLTAVQALLASSEVSPAIRPPAASAGPATSSGPSSGLEPLRIARRDSRDKFERDYLVALLARTEGNVTRAAAIAEVSRQMVQKLLRKYKIG